MGSLERKAAVAEEVGRRLRLDRFPKVGVTVGPIPGADYDAVVMLASPNADLAARARELCADLRVKVRQGVWQRS